MKDMDIKKKLPMEWAYLFTLYISDNHIFEGKTKFNKFIAELQLRGFPVDNIFYKKQLGSYELEHPFVIRNLKERGLIDVKLVSLGLDEFGFCVDRHDYILTEKGKEYFEREILPILKEFPNYNEMVKEAKILLDFYSQRTAHQIVTRNHQLLILDDEKRYIKKLQSIRAQLEILFENYQNTYQAYCRSGLKILSMTEFIIRTLDKIENKYLYDDRIGRYNIVYNSDIFLTKLKGFDDIPIPLLQCQQAGKCLMLRECDISELVNIFNRIEADADRYNIQKSFQSDEFDFADYMTTEEIECLWSRISHRLQLRSQK